MHFDDGMDDGGESFTASGDSSQGPLESEEYEGGDAYHFTARRTQGGRKSDPRAVDEHARSAFSPTVLFLELEFRAMG